MKYAVTLSITLLFLGACVEEIDKNADSPSKLISEEAKFVPFARLIAQPEAYYGRNIITDGVLMIEREGSTLFANREYYENGIYQWSFLVDWSFAWVEKKSGISNLEFSEYADGNYCRVVGLFLEAGGEHHPTRGVFMDRMNGVLKIREVLPDCEFNRGYTDLFGLIRVRKE